MGLHVVRDTEAGRDAGPVIVAFVAQKRLTGARTSDDHAALSALVDCHLDAIHAFNYRLTRNVEDAPRCPQTLSCACTTSNGKHQSASGWPLTSSSNS